MKNDRIIRSKLLQFSIFILLGFCSSVSAKSLAIETVSASRAKEIDSAFLNILEKHKINTAGVGIIKNGKLIWQNQYGQQKSGVPASPETLFNVGSITKTVTAETILRLVTKGKLSLDESMADYWLDPDLQGSKYLTKLTPRAAITHTSGFMNWRFFSDDFKLKFVNEPGTRFGYSGEGFRYLAKYAENKMGEPFDVLVKKTIFDPIGITDASLKVDKANFSRIAQALDENGKFYGHYCHPQGYCSKENEISAAGNMVITVKDYAKFLISSMLGEGLNKQLMQDRDTIQTIEVNEGEIDCSHAPKSQCPTQLGYGLGWYIAQLNNDKLIGHRGSDWSVVSVAYYYQNSKDGIIIFLNAHNKAGIAGMIDALNVLDPDSPEIHGYKLRLARTN